MDLKPHATSRFLTLTFITGLLVQVLVAPNIHVSKAMQIPN
jgi:hypothetical protein